jgi:adenylosuccinate lyase
MEGLVVHPQRMRETLQASRGLVYSQRVLLGLVERGLTREDAYALVQRNAMRAWDEGLELRDLLAADPEVGAVLPAGELEQLFDPRWYTRHMGPVWEQVAAL